MQFHLLLPVGKGMTTIKCWPVDVSKVGLYSHMTFWKDLSSVTEFVFFYGEIMKFIVPSLLPCFMKTHNFRTNV